MGRRQINSDTLATEHTVKDADISFMLNAHHRLKWSVNAFWWFAAAVE